MLALVDVVLVIGVTGYAVYALTMDVGLYAWLAELQARVFGGHFPLLTAALAVLPLVALAVGAHALAKRVFGEPPVRAASQTRMLAQMGVASLAGGLVAAWVAYGSYSEQREYVVVNVAEPPATHAKYVELVGVDQAREGVAVSLGDSRSDYVPVTAPGWNRAQAVTYFGTGGAYIQASPGVAAKQVRRGALVKNGLPSVAKAAFSRQGTIVAEPHYLLDPHPFSEVVPYVIALAGVLVGILCLLSAVLVARGGARPGETRR